MTNRIEELRMAGLAKAREGAPEEALGYYDQALALTDDETARELIAINKADALISLERTGPEVQELARVIMRRRNTRHVYLAAYSLQYKHRVENNFKRAIFYAEIALRTAEEANEPVWRRLILYELGNIYTLDSQITRAIECFQEVTTIYGEAANVPEDQQLAHSWGLESLGYCIMLDGRIEEGLERIHEAVRIMGEPVGLAEAYVDLCYGYLELENLGDARKYGEAALEIANDPRHIRNAHYLLGEVEYKSGDVDAADYHFSELARYYPEFTNLKSLLFAIDLRSMVNLKL